MDRCNQKMPSDWRIAVCNRSPFCNSHQLWMHVQIALPSLARPVFCLPCGWAVSLQTHHHQALRPRWCRCHWPVKQLAQARIVSDPFTDAAGLLPGQRCDSFAHVQDMQAASRPNACCDLCRHGMYNVWRDRMDFDACHELGMCSKPVSSDRPEKSLS